MAAKSIGLARKAKPYARQLRRILATTRKIGSAGTPGTADDALAKELRLGFARGGLDR